MYPLQERVYDLPFLHLGSEHLLLKGAFLPPSSNPALEQDLLLYPLHVISSVTFCNSTIMTHDISICMSCLEDGACWVVGLDISHLYFQYLYLQEGVSKELGDKINVALTLRFKIIIKMK